MAPEARETKIVSPWVNKRIRTVFDRKDDFDSCIAIRESCIRFSAYARILSDNAQILVALFQGRHKTVVFKKKRINSELRHRGRHYLVQVLVQYTCQPYTTLRRLMYCTCWNSLNPTSLRNSLNYVWVHVLSVLDSEDPIRDRTVLLLCHLFRRQTATKRECTLTAWPTLPSVWYLRFTTSYLFVAVCLLTIVSVHL